MAFRERLARRSPRLRTVEMGREWHVELVGVTQQRNTDLKKKNRMLKAIRENQAMVQEKTRVHSKLMHTFHVECENNKELMKRLREVQSRRTKFRK